MRALRKRIAVVAVILSLAGLGGIAWGSNPEAPLATVAPPGSQSASSNPSPVSTGTSGAAAAPVVDPQPFPGATVVGGLHDD